MLMFLSFPFSMIGLVSLIAYYLHGNGVPPATLWATVQIPAAWWSAIVWPLIPHVSTLLGDAPPLIGKAIYFIAKMWIFFMPWLVLDVIIRKLYLAVSGAGKRTEE